METFNILQVLFAMFMSFLVGAGITAAIALYVIKAK